MSLLPLARCTHISPPALQGSLTEALCYSRDTEILSPEPGKVLSDNGSGPHRPGPGLLGRTVETGEEGPGRLAKANPAHWGVGWVSPCPTCAPFWPRPPALR